MEAIIDGLARRARHIFAFHVATAFLAALLAVIGILGSTASLAQTGRLLQVSTRGQVLTGDDVMIAGFVIGGPAPKTVVVTVAGPSLAGLVAGPLQDPTVTLVRQSDGAVLKANDNWQAQAVAADFPAIVASGLQPGHGLEPAIIATLPPGAYTAVVRGAGGATGVAVVGVYEVDHPEVPLLNIATRARVLTGENVVIAGFAIGPADRTVVVTVTGPSLAGLVPSPLQNPSLTLVRMSDGAVIGTNDDWQVQANPADVAALQANGLQPADSREPAIIATLQPGLYTAIASGVGADTGTAVVAVYQASRDVAITSANGTTFTVGTAGTFTVTTAGSPPATSVTATGALPAGVTFTPGITTGTLSGTPGPGTGGTYNLTITASNGGVTPNGTQSFTLTVNQAPAITSANAATFQTASPNAHTVVATGFPAPTLSVTGALPPGVTFNPTNGQLAGTPTAAGNFPLVFTAANGTLPNATQNFTLTVTDGAVAVNDAFNVVHDTVATPFAAPGILANDLGTPAPLVFSVTGLTTCSAFPCTVATTNGSITVQANGAFTYTPTAGYAGTDSFTYVAINTGGTSAPATVTLTVTNALAVVDLDGAATGGINSAATFTEGGGPVAIVGTVNPNWLTVTDADNTTLASATMVLTNALDGPSELLALTCPSGPPPACSGAIQTTDIVATPAPGTYTITITRVAPFADYEALLRTLTYNNASVAPNPTQRDVTVTVNDGFGASNPVAHALVTIAGVNQAPTITVPGAQTTPVNTPRVFSTGNGNAISVADPDAAAADVQVTLTATNGTVSLSTTAGFTSVTGNGTATVVATGPLAAQNAALNGLSFTPTAAFVSPPNATLTVNISDLGNTGTGGPLSAAPATVQITVATAPTITSANATTFIVGQSTPFTVTTTASPPVTTITRGGVALPGGVTYVDNLNGTATLGGTPDPGTAGTYVFTFTASNGVPPDAVQNPFTLTIAAQGQTITFTSVAPGAATVGGATYNVTATATSGLAVTFAIDASASTVCTIAGSTVSFIGAGTCVINANQAGNATFGPAPQVQQSFAVAPASQTISFTSVAPAAATFGGPTYNVTATATSGLPVAFTIDAAASTVCSIAGSTVSFIGVGTCVINANQAGNASYNPAPQVQQSFAVGQASQTISFTSIAPTNATVGGATYGVTATATSGLAVTFTIDAAASTVCSIAGSTVSFIGAGTCVINANQAGNANYSAAPQVQQSFAVKNAQTIAFTSSPPATPTVGGATYIVTATATSGLAVVFTIDASASAVCSIAGSTVSFIGGGTCVINANQPGDASYYAAPQVQQSFTVKSAQAITFTSVPPAAAVYQGPTYTVTATGGASGNPITFTIDASASTVCSIAGSVVSFIGTGTCVINANQLGNALYYDAPQVQQSFTVGPNLVGDAYGVVGNTQLVVAGHSSPATPFTANATGILANDTSNVAITVTAVTGVATTGGGLITISAAGAFTYTPPVGQASGTDTYVYTGTSSGVSRTATITFNIANVVWYVNRTAPAGGNGRSNTPFDTLTGAQAPSAANSYIYVHAGGAPTATTGSLVMDAGQELRGEGVAFTLGALSLAAGTRPVLSGTVTLADDTLVTGVNFVNASPALLGNGFTATQPILIDQVNVTGGTNALSLTNVNGSVGVGLTFSNAAISNTTAAEVLVSGGNIPLTFPATTTLSGNAGRLIDIQGRTGNAVSFAGALTDTGTGIFLNNNTSTAFAFTGGMTLNGTGTTFTATNAGPAVSGTLSITGTNNIGATTAPTSGTALNVAHIGFPAGGITFRSVHQNGGTSGIVINNTGSTAGLTVAGNGVATVGGDSSGGTLQNLSSYGVQLTSTRSVSLTNMNIQSAGRSGVDGQLVTNFTFASGTINNVGTAALGQYEESNIAFNDGGSFTTSSVDGAVAITNSILNNARRHGIQIENGTGTISNLTITGNALTSSTVATTSLGSAILVLAQGSAATNAHITTGSISSNTITNFPSGEGILIGGGSGNGGNGTSSTLGANGTPIVITSNSINGGSGANRMGSNAIRAAFNGQLGVANFTISNNPTITNIRGQGISVFMGGTVTGTTTISGNTIVANQTDLAGTQGLAVQVDDGPAGAGTSAADYNFIITSNNVSNYEGFGIRAIARASNGKMDITIQNNTVGTPIMANRNGIRVDSGSAVGNVTTCLLMTGNTSAGSGVNQGMGIRKQGTVLGVNTFGITGLAPSPTNGTTAAAKVTTDNPAGNGTDWISGDNFVACTVSP